MKTIRLFLMRRLCPGGWQVVPDAFVIPPGKHAHKNPPKKADRVKTSPNKLQWCVYDPDHICDNDPDCNPSTSCLGCGKKPLFDGKEEG